MANNDVNVSLGLDDSEYNRGLNRARDAINKFSNDYKTAMAEMGNGTNNLNNSTNQLGSAFARLSTAILGAFSVKAIADMAEWANTISQTAKATGYTTGELVGLQSAVMQAGGTARAASLGIEMFYMKLDQARQGGYTQQEAFRRIGITLGDLKKYDDQQLFEKTIKSLAALPPSAERNRIEVELLSKSFRGIPLQEVAALLDANKGKWDEFGPTLDVAAKAFQQLQVDMTTFKIGALTVVEPLLQAFTQFKPTVEDVIDTIRKLAAAIGAVIAFGLAGRVIEYAMAFTTLAEAIAGATVALKAFAVGEAAAANATGLGAILSLLLKIAVAAAAYFGVTKLVDSALESNTQKHKEAEQAAKDKANADKESSRAANEVYDATARENAAIRQQTEAFIHNIQAQINMINVRRQAVGAGEIEIARTNEYLRVFDEYGRKIEEVTVKLQAAKNATPSDQSSKTVGALEQQLKTLRELQKVDAEDAGAAAARRQSAISVDQMKLKLMEDQIKVQYEYQNIVHDIENITATADERKLIALQKEQDQYIKLAMEKRRAQLGTNITDEELLNDGEIQKYIIGIDKAYDKIRKGTQDQIKASREWQTGWGTAFNQYVEDATNAANASKSIFEKATQGMEDAFVNFAKTGKLSFQDMTATILEEILRIQLRMVAANIMGAGNGGGMTSLFSGVKKLFGFASGGVVAGNAPIIVGERGPEIFTPAGGGTITPNNQLGVGTNVTYNINAVDAASFKSMLARDPSFLYALTLQGRKSIPGAA
jgi:lambda family phage tail tape measure protein